MNASFTRQARQGTLSQTLTDVAKLLRWAYLTPEEGLAIARRLEERRTDSAAALTDAARAA